MALIDLGTFQAVSDVNLVQGWVANFLPPGGLIIPYETVWFEYVLYSIPVLLWSVWDVIPDVWPSLLGIDYDNLTQYVAEDVLEEDDVLSLFFPIVEMLWDVGILG